MPIEKLIKITPGFPVRFPQEERFGEDFAGFVFWTGYDSKGNYYIVPAYRRFPEDNIPESKLLKLDGIHLAHVKASEKRILEQYLEVV